MELNISMQIVFPIVLLIMNLVMSVGVAMIIFFMRGNRDANKDRFKGIENKHEKLVDDLSEFKSKLPHQYVLRDDFIRILTSFDHKLDAQVEALNKIQATIIGEKT